jgi:hypothetical protein
MVIVDDCGNVVTSGSAGNTFSSGDRPIDLVPLGDGRWRAVWVPRTDAGYTAINIAATDTAQTIGSGQTPPLRGYVQDRINAPLLSVAQAVVTVDGQPQLAVAPGSWIRIRGSGFADSPAQATGIPQPQLGKTAASIGGFSLQLQSVTPTEILALVPSNIAVNTSLPLIVANGDRQSAPESVLVAQSWPVIHTASMEVASGERFLTVELSGVGAVHEGRPRVPVAIRVGNSESRVDSLVADPIRPGVYRVRLRIESDVREVTSIEAATPSARTSRARVTR